MTWYPSNRKMHKDYLNINRKSWNQRTPVHVKSDFYDVKGFLQGKSSLNGIELDLLGDIRGKSLLHLQCHFGTDTLSLERMGARCTGVDLSDVAIAEAMNLAAQTGLNSEFIRCDIYDLPNHLDRQFDLVFTSYGTISWLPDINKWAGIVSRYLKPGGKFIFVEFHPVVWMFDYKFQKIENRYFNSEPFVEKADGTYADRKAPIRIEFVSWNHGLAEVVNGLIKKGLTICDFREYDYSPYDCFDETVKIAEKKIRIKHLGDKIPLVYSLVAEKK